MQILTTNSKSDNDSFKCKNHQKISKKLKIQYAQMNALFFLKRKNMALTIFD